MKHFLGLFLTHLRLRLWGIVLMFFLVPQTADASGILVLASRTGKAYEEVIEGIRTELNRSTEVRVQYLSGPAATWKNSEPASLIVTVGVDAASAAVQGADPGIPVLCILIPRVAFEAVAARKKDGRRLSAIYLDTPYQRQLELIRALLPQVSQVGTVLGEVSVRDKDALKTLARERGLNLQWDFAQRDSELYPVLKSVLSESEVFLAIPDPVVINTSTAQNVLITAFRSQVPVIGFSASYVKAGALAAVYSTPQQIGSEAGQIIKSAGRGNNLPLPKYPRYFSVGVNAALMRSLGLPATDEQALAQRLIKVE